MRLTRLGSTTLVIAIALAPSAARAAASPPHAASPGDPSGFAVVVGPCPAFSWGAVAGAERVDLTLYAFNENGVVEPSPRLYESLPGTVTSWTPPLGRCPERGKRYAWTVRAIIAGEETEWSESRFFRLSEAPTMTEVEEALEVLRRYTGDELGEEPPSGSAVPRERDGLQRPAPPVGSRELRTKLMAERAPSRRSTRVEAAAQSRDKPSPLREALRSGTLSARAPSPRGATLEPDYALALGKDLLVGGHIFKDGYPLLHTDGGFDSGNTALGLDALTSTTPDFPSLGNGEFNSALGQRALRNNTEGAFNTAVGGLALYSNTSGEQNTAVGALALVYNTAGPRNTAVGHGALAQNTSGSNNTALGHIALADNIASYNTAVGKSALEANTTGTSNTAVGHRALQNSINGATNTAMGASVLSTNTTGDRNTAVGAFALAANTTGSANTALGRGVLQLSADGYANTGLGYSALDELAAGSGNVAAGANALSSLEEGSVNVALGRDAGSALKTGDNNVALGWLAQVGSDSSSGNIVIGGFTGRVDMGSGNIYLDSSGETGDENTIRIGNGLHEAAFVAGVRGTNVANGLTVLVGSLGRLGTTTSSRRFKEEIEDMGDASAALLALRPVTFRYREGAVDDGPRPIDFGLIAEEVAEIYPDLVAYDEEGKPYSVRYHVLPAMLLNELQRQQRELRRLKKRLHVIQAESAPKEMTRRSGRPPTISDSH